MTYNPSILDLRYLKLIPQNAIMTFRNYVYYLGPTAISNIWATTTNGWNLWYDFLTTTIVWDLLQTYASIKTPTINPIGGTLTIGNEAVDTNVEISTQTGRNVVLHLGNGPSSTGGIHIGNGLASTNHVNILYAAAGGSSGTINLGSATGTTNLRCPLTPVWTYTDIPMSVATNGTITYGTAGTVGYTLVNSDTYGSYFGGSSNTMVETKLSLSIPPGMWYLVGEVICYSTYGQLDGLSFGLTAPTNPITARPAGFFGGDYVVCFSSTAQNNQVIPLGGGAMTISAPYTNNTGSNVTVRLFHFRPGYGWLGNGNRGYFTATKLA